MCFAFTDYEISSHLTLHQTFSTLSIFILVMSLSPEAQKHAQAEIDSAIGSNVPRWELEVYLLHLIPMQRSKRP